MTSFKILHFPVFMTDRKVLSSGRRLPNGEGTTELDISFIPLRKIPAPNPERALKLAKAMYPTFPLSLAIGPGEML
jgi:hypothetical protein